MIEHKPVTYWYAVFCKPRQEEVAEENLMRQGYRVYLPRVKVTKHLRGRWEKVIEPLFPRYLFIQLDILKDNIAPVRFTRGVAGLVRFGGQLAVLPEALVDDLRAREEQACRYHKGYPLLKAGDDIKFVNGPFAGLEGVFAQEDGESRAIVLLELLGKTNKIKISFDWIAPTA